MEDKIKVLALFGESASGKDTIQKYITTQWPDWCNSIVSCTTRPKRDYEIDGIDYHFLTNAEFAEKVLNLSMLEATEFNDWFYGTPIDSLKPDMLNVGVFNPNGIRALLTDSRIQVLPLYVYASDKTRLLRSLSREENPNCYEICRRYMADVKDFDELDFDYCVIDNGAEMDKEAIESYVFDFNYYCPNTLIK